MTAAPGDWIVSLHCGPVCVVMTAVEFALHFEPLQEVVA
jgi:hypothetical protein